MGDSNGEIISNYHKILDDRIGYGEAQKRIGLPITLIIFSEGFEIISLGLILPILTKQWNLTLDDQTLLLTVIGLGMPIGTFIQGFADHYGRRFMITVNGTFLVIFGLISVVCWNLTSFMIVRCLYTVGIGIAMPLNVTYLN